MYRLNQMITSFGFLLVCIFSLMSQHELASMILCMQYAGLILLNGDILFSTTGRMTCTFILTFLFAVIFVPFFEIGFLIWYLLNKMVDKTPS